MRALTMINSLLHKYVALSELELLKDVRPSAPESVHSKPISVDKFHIKLRRKMQEKNMERIKKLEEDTLSKPKNLVKKDVDARQSNWEPPASPYSLIEETLYDDPWKLLVTCILLNVTRSQKLIPNAHAASSIDTELLEQIIHPLGLHRKRAAMLKKFSREYLEKDWRDPQELHGIGQYGADAYYIFCRNDWKERPPPKDKDLLKYYEFLVETGGEGKGYAREIFL